METTIKNQVNITSQYTTIRENFQRLSFFICAVIFWELGIYFMVYNDISFHIGYITVFALPLGCFFSFIGGLFKGKAATVINWLILILLFLLYCTYIIYYQILGSILSVYLITMGGDAIGSFYTEVLWSIAHNIPEILLLTVPLIAYGVLRRTNFISKRKQTKKQGLANIALTIILHIAAIATLLIAGTGTNTPYYLYFNSAVTTDQSSENFGIIPTVELEIANIIIGSNETLNTMPNNGTFTADNYNIDESLDFSSLKNNKDKTIASLSSYLANTEPTEKNQYTGIFEGYNLIEICAEAFSPYLINETATPTLYKLANEGFVFNNFYTSFPNTTTNGEYTLCTGLFPDLSRSKTANSFALSAQNYEPYCLGNMFNSDGAKSYAYHYYDGNYYDRNLSHPNMGYSFASAGNGLPDAESNPSSDLTLFESSVNDYINKDRFNSYYMTFSGHYSYDFTTNDMSIQNQAEVKGKPYSKPVLAYLACNYELEKGLTYLLEQLEEAGIADKTVIVLTADHYPYGLSPKEYNELAGTEIDTAFERYRSSFICWSGSMTEPIEINTYCSTVDILPTMLNLFGMEYDSRLLVGKDIFSKGEHMAILYNGSFITKDMKYNSSTNKATYTEKAPTLNNKELTKKIQEVRDKFTVSQQILNTDFYSYLKNQ